MPSMSESIKPTLSQIDHPETVTIPVKVTNPIELKDKPISVVVGTPVELGKQPISVMSKSTVQAWEYRKVPMYTTWEHGASHNGRRDVASAYAEVSEAKLNELGAEGFELVCTIHEPFGEVMYFKRPKGA